MVDSWEALRAWALAILSVDGSGRQGRRRRRVESDLRARKVIGLITYQSYDAMGGEEEKEKSV